MKPSIFAEVEGLFLRRGRHPRYVLQVAIFYLLFLFHSLSDGKCLPQ